MSYGAAAALQAAIYGRLTAAAALAGVAVLDAVPSGGGTGTFVLIGPEEVFDQSDKTGGGAEHRLTVAVISDAAGFQAAKDVAVAVSDALVDAPLALARGNLVGLRFLKAKAVRLDNGLTRRIDLSFRARVED
ncbi:DUF3168 domain-containing protein [Pseudorhodobacter wandonensis]|jgi:hypothetical protein|uniref:DUF3168 domain-containing protein n=1 Tax=Pseudorhodobacter wandonensis TaxID=1120568 RepID=UPI00067AAE09|nr:DUF3168 domain-containing protein [Pseudorhodobacter wandonensis]